jgi:hypothetical protein
VDDLGVYRGAYRLGLVMLNDENSFNHEGITYRAIHCKTCRECVFEFTDPCIVCGEQPYCMSTLRNDGKDVIWQKQESAWSSEK